MPDKTEFNMDFRPKSYWVFDSLDKKVKATVKGEVRRSVAEFCLENPELMGVDPCAFDISLSEIERARRSKMHPMFMGGEFLPDYLQGEVEIARVSMQSVTADVVSVRAHWEKGKIHYQIVDEYIEDNGPYTISFESSLLPLTMAELIHLVDSAIDPYGEGTHGIRKH